MLPGTYIKLSNLNNKKMWGEKIKKIAGDNKVTYNHAFPIGPVYNIKGDNFEIKAINRGTYECSTRSYK